MMKSVGRFHSINKIQKISKVIYTDNNNIKTYIFHIVTNVYINLEKDYKLRQGIVIIDEKETLCDIKMSDSCVDDNINVCHKEYILDYRESRLDEYKNFKQSNLFAIDLTKEEIKFLFNVCMGHESINDDINNIELLIQRGWVEAI